MPTNDIHVKEQTTAPILKPLVTNKDIPALDSHDVDLIKKAFNYIQQHRPQLDRENGARTNPIMQDHENHNRGHVVDPEHDHRLTKNKEREDDDRKEREEAEARQKEEDAKRNQKKLEEIKQLQQHHKTPDAFPHHTAGAMTMTPPTSMPKLQGPGNFNMPKGAPVPKPVDINAPKLKTPVKQRPSAMPNGTTPYGPEETALRNHPIHGPAVNKLLGTQPATPELLNRVRDNLQKRQTIASSIEERNDIQTTLSYVAALLIKAGKLN